jgi:hypothetical protein
VIGTSGTASKKAAATAPAVCARRAEKNSATHAFRTLDGNRAATSGTQHATGPLAVRAIPSRAARKASRRDHFVSLAGAAHHRSHYLFMAMADGTSKIHRFSIESLRSSMSAAENAWLSAGQPLDTVTIGTDRAVLGMVPDGVRKQAGGISDARNGVALNHHVDHAGGAAPALHQSQAAASRAGNVTLQSPASGMPSTRAFPSASRNPDTLLPSGSVIWYCSHGIGFSSSPTNSTSIQWSSILFC